MNEPANSGAYPTRVALSFKSKHGWIVLDQIRAVDKTRLINKLGHLDSKFVQPGFCNRREPKDEKACGHFCSERRKRTPSGTVEELGTKVFQDFSSTATSYCKFRVQQVKAVLREMLVD